MRNYFKALGLDTTATKETLEAAMGSGQQTAKELDPRHRADAIAVLSAEERRDTYASTTELFETLRGAISCLDEPEAQDGHRWKDRLSEFDNVESERT